MWALISIAGMLAAGSSFSQSTDTKNELVVAFRNNQRGQFDPQTSDNGINLFSSSVFDTLMVKNAVGEIQPALATSWKVSDKNSVLTLTLRRGVKFHNGETFDAAAVKASIVRGQTLKTSRVAGALAPITSMDVIDASTIALRVSQGRAKKMVGVLTGAPGVIVPPVASQAPNFSVRPVGTGPWMVSGESDATSRMVYDAVPNYMDPSVQGVKRIRIEIRNSEAIKNGLRDGSTDYGEVASRADAEVVQRAGLVVVDTSHTAGLKAFHLNKSPGHVFSDENLRRAVSHAINRQELADNVYNPLGFHKCQATSQPFPPASPVFDKSLPPVQYDPARAKQLMAAAGKPDGFTFNAQASSSFAPFKTDLAAIKQQLAGVGITMNITLQPLVALGPDWAAGKYDALYGGIITESDPSLYLGSLNLGGFTDAKMAKALEEANAAVDPQAEAKALQAWSAGFQEAAFGITICNQPMTAFVKPGVKGITYKGANWVDFRGVTKSTK